MSSEDDEPRQRLRDLHGVVHDDVLRFLQRRVPHHDAEDVLAEAFLVAWRRVDELPRRPGDARAWMFGIARKCLLNSRRGATRQQAVAVRLAQSEAARGVDALPLHDEADLRVDLAAAWAQLSTADQEVLALTVLDELTSPQAAAVLGITAAAYRVRLLRARRCLRRHLEAPEPVPPPAPDQRPPSPRRDHRPPAPAASPTPVPQEVQP